MTDPLNTETLKYQVNRARFVGRDYYTVLDDLLAFLREQYGDTFNDFVASDQGVMLLELVSWAAESLTWGQDRYATESYSDTARTRRAMNRLARQLGYKMVPSTASTVDLSVNLAEIHAFDATIPLGFQFQGPNGLIFENTGPVTFLAGEGPLSPSRTVSCREGSTVSASFRSDGSKDQRFSLNPGVGKFIALGTVVGQVAGVTWTESTDFLTYEKTNQYEVDYNNEPPLMVFGNGTAGNVPPTGADIQVSFLADSGKAGRVPAHTITSVVRDLVVAFTTIGLIIDNPNPSSAGDDREDIEVTRRNLPTYFAARDVAVTSPDYTGLANAFRDPVSGAVAMAQAFITTSAASDTTLQDLLDLIRNVTATLEADVLAQTAQLVALLAGMTTDLADTTAQLVLIGNAVTAAQAASTTCRTNISSAKAQQAVVQANAAAGVAAVLAIAGPGAVDDLTPPTRVLLNLYYNGANLAALAADADLTNALIQLGTIDTNVSVISTAQTAIQGEVTSLTLTVGLSSTAVNTINTLVSAGFEATIDGYLTDIFNHVDAFLSSVCQANLVTVQILALDADGFYVAPSTALIRSLQAHLSARCELTQVVVVVSGESRLVVADLTGVIGVLSGYTPSAVRTQVQEKVYDLLRRREGGVYLRISDLDGAAVPKNGVGGVEGVKYVNWRITGPAGKIDADGNLAISASEIITRGVITLTTEAA